MQPPTATLKGLLSTDCPSLATDSLFTEWRERAQLVYRAVLMRTTPAMASSESFRKLLDMLCVKALEEAFTAELSQRGLLASAAAGRFKILAASKQRTPDVQAELQHLTEYASQLGPDLIKALSRPSPSAFNIETRLAPALANVKMEDPDVMSVEATLDKHLTTERIIKMVKSPASYLMYLGDAVAQVEGALNRAGKLKADASVAVQLFNAREALLVSSGLCIRACGVLGH
jgi:hydroxypyruvate isomerase